MIKLLLFAFKMFCFFVVEVKRVELFSPLCKSGVIAVILNPHRLLNLVEIEGTAPSSLLSTPSFGL